MAQMIFIFTLCYSIFLPLKCLAEETIDHFQAGKEQKQKGNLNAAIDEFVAALKTSDEGKIHFELGALYLVKARTGESISELEKSVNKGDLSKDMRARANDLLALALMRSGEILKAKTSIAAALKEYPDDFGYIQRSIEICLDAVKQNPISSSNHVDLGQSYQRAGRFDQAHAEYMQALLFDQKNQDAKELLGKLPEARKAYEEARAKSKH